jgi:NAD(P)-dependent dehydrogenase (short-subunit alcohol dehydrogenase family)
MRTVLITGSGSGLGRAAALQFARENYNVVVSDVNIAGGEETLQLIEATGGRAIFVPCNVVIPAEVDYLFEQIMEKYGRLDAAVNNAGIGGSGLTPTHLYDLKVHEQVMAVNVTGVLLCMQAELRIMLKQGSGAIVNVASAAGLIGMPNNIAYSASKHAVVGMSRTAALEYAKKNIRINAVCPAFAHSAMVQELIEMREDMEDRLIQSIPMKRIAQASEIAEAVLWLCSDKSSFMTGHAMAVDGGVTAA